MTFHEVFFKQLNKKTIMKEKNQTSEKADVYEISPTASLNNWNETMFRGANLGLRLDCHRISLAKGTIAASTSGSCYPVTTVKITS